SLIAAEKLEGAAADAMRMKFRQERTKPKLEAFAAWLEAELPKLLPKSPIALAIAYARRHWQALTRFTEHGFLNIDNNASERDLRAVAVGRKN
ncbi:IS66 family transposase, partial [Vibrio parahaemolyticus]